ncbi:MAG: hydantoinase/oxoprolinase N-terminal domain-containing protein, partial [Thermodesulfobacteriota bacterium]|nr:hydantoinase/oxoprolinase N-terminal domain-containing protein [Thermodesulfobacteriota bacterium]
MEKEYYISVDTGGTFADCVVADHDGNVIIDKASSTPRDFSQGVLASVKVAAKRLGISMEKLLEQTKLFFHGTTVATNAIIVRSGVKVGLITTRGFEDTAFIMRGRGRTDGLLEMEIRHETTARKPETLIPRYLVKGVTERVDLFGNVLVPLNKEEVYEAVNYLVEEQGVEAIAVCFLWSFRHPEHEEEVKRIIKEKYPDLWVSISTELAPSHREYPRTNTAIIDSYVGPITNTYLGHLEEALNRSGYKY